MKINPKNILVIKLRAIGDLVLMSPVLENLRKNFPNSNIDLLTDKNVSQIMLYNPFISSLLTFDKKRENSISIIKTVRAKKYDTVIDLFGNPRSAIITLLSGAKNRIGFNFKIRKYAYNFKIESVTKNTHNVDSNLNVLRNLEIPISTREPKVYLHSGLHLKADEWYKVNNLSGKILIGINVGGGWQTKKYLPEYYIKVISKILEKIDAYFIILWGPNEFNDAKLISDWNTKNCHLIPSATILEMSALISKLNFMISNDSGAMHIAAALGIKTLGIFGPTTPENQGPFGKGHLVVRNEKLNCLECQLTKCPIGNICMTELEPEIVANSFFKLLNSEKVN